MLLLTSNRGLAGGFNSNLIKEARRRIEALEAEGYTVDLYAVGKKGVGFFRFMGRKLALERLDIGDKPTAAHAAELAEPLIDGLRGGQAGPASRSSTPGSTARSRRRPPLTQVLPVEPPAAAEGRRQHDYILKPERRGDPRGAAAALRARTWSIAGWSRRRPASTARGAPR